MIKVKPWVIMLLGAATTSNPNLLIIFLLIASLTHLSTEEFLKDRLFGSIGWVEWGIFSIIFIRLLNINFEATHILFYCVTGLSFIAVLLNFTLPDTPPPANGEKNSMIKIFDLLPFSKTKKLFKRNQRVNLKT